MGEWLEIVGSSQGASTCPSHQSAYRVECWHALGYWYPTTGFFHVQVCIWLCRLLCCHRPVGTVCGGRSSRGKPTHAHMWTATRALPQVLQPGHCHCHLASATGAWWLLCGICHGVPQLCLMCDPAFANQLSYIISAIGLTNHGSISHIKRSTCCYQYVHVKSKVTPWGIPSWRQPCPLSWQAKRATSVLWCSPSTMQKHLHRNLEAALIEIIKGRNQSCRACQRQPVRVTSASASPRTQRLKSYTPKQSNP